MLKNVDKHCPVDLQAFCSIQFQDLFYNKIGSVWFYIRYNGVDKPEIN